MPLGRSDIEKLYERHAQELLGFFLYRTFDADAAVELLGETFAAAVAGRESFRGDPRETGRAWVYGIAHNLLREHYRRGRVERNALRRLGVEPQPLTTSEHELAENALAASSIRDALARELDALPREQRDAVRLRVLDEQSYQALSRILGVSEQTARARVSRGLRALRASPAITRLIEGER